MSKREFQFSAGTSNKFWNITLNGKSHTVEYGRIGTNGQSKTKDFGSAEEATKDYDKLISTKLKEGYTEISTDGPTATKTATPAAPAPVPQPVLAVQASVQAAGPTVTQTAATPTAPAPVQTQGSAQVAEKIVEEKPSSTTNRDESKGTQYPEPQEIISLTPEEWLWNVSRPYEIQSVPPARLFSKENALEIIRKAKTGKYGQDWRQFWEKYPLPRNISRQEAHFWLVAYSRLDYHTKPAELCERLEKLKNDGQISIKEIKKIVPPNNVLTANFVVALATLFDVNEIVDVVFEGDPDEKNRPYTHDGLTTVILYGFRRYILPYLTGEEKKRLQERLKPEITVGKWRQRDDNTRPLFVLAAILGLSAELKAVVESIADDYYKDDEYSRKQNADRIQMLIFGLGDSDLVKFHMERLGLPLQTPYGYYYGGSNADYMLAWLSYTGLTALEKLRDTVQASNNAEEAKTLFAAFDRVIAPQAAPYVLDLKINSKAVASAREWLDAHPVEAVAGLVKTAAGRDKLAGPAQNYLLEINVKGFGDLIRRESGKAGSEVVEAVRKTVFETAGTNYVSLDDSNTPEWLPVALKPLAKQKDTKLPGWAVAGLLSPVVINRSKLNEEQVTQLLQLLRAGEGEALRDQLKPFRQKENGVDQSSLDKFAWKIFENWLHEGAPSKEKWALSAVGVLGGDSSALKLTPLIRTWPGEAQHQRAVLGLDVLRNIGTDTALMQINGIAQKVPFKGIKERALETINAIAEDRQMTRTQLEDRIVPDAGLDERGTTVFDFGPRQFTFALSPELKALVRDDSGKLKPDLPKPNSSDDTEKANAAIEEWKLIKKQVRETSKIQADRLEQAMITGRRWPVGEFEQLLVNHPLMTFLVRTLVWAAYDKSGKMTGTFRVTEDRTYADQNDDTYKLDPEAEVEIVHPAHLDDHAKADWGQILSDYEIIPPFQQLGRTIYRLEPGEADQTEITRFANFKVPAVTLVGMLEKAGWTRGIPEDGGVFHEHSKPFYGADVTVFVEYDGVPVGYMIDWDDQAIEKCYFMPGNYTPMMYARHDNALKLGKVDEVVISEVLRDLNAIASKAKQ